MPPAAFTKNVLHTDKRKDYVESVKKQAQNKGKNLNLSLVE